MSDCGVEAGGDRVHQLIAELSDFREGRCCEAQFALIALGRSTLVPSMDRLGQLHAINVFEDLADAWAGDTLTRLLLSEHDTVREWAARVLGVLEIGDAVPALRRAYRSTRERGTPPEWTEPVSIRHALSALGAREPVVPALSRSLEVRVPKLGSAWPAARLRDVVNDLADHDQVILYFQLWRVDEGKAHGIADAEGSWGDHLNYAESWPALVNQAREWALLYASEIRVDPEAVATIEWIDKINI